MIGSLKQHGGMREFQRRGLINVGVEFALAAIALNLKRWYRVRHGPNQAAPLRIRSATELERVS